MTDNIAIKVEHVSKKYCKSLKRSMLYGIKDITRNAVGLRSHSNILRRDEFWALDDVSFEVKRGGTVGIIGPNGSGKTTLLKLLNGIFWPNKGKISIRGRVGALIEIGAGFHPMLTGRENIYINGAILGMTKKEIDGKFDSIVGFANIGDFLDTPVKYYSSGMFVRLGFAIAVHSEPDVLLVDETLSVGDMSFQRKCIERMRKFSTDGRCVVFVSHNMLSIQGLSRTVVYLKNGRLIEQGDPLSVIANYSNDSNTASLTPESDPSADRHGSGEIFFTEVNLTHSSGEKANLFPVGSELCIQAKYEAKVPLTNIIFRFAIVDVESGIFVAVGDTQGTEMPRVIQGKGVIRCVFESLPLRPRRYSIYLTICGSDLSVAYDRWMGAAHFAVSASYIDKHAGFVHGQKDLLHLPFHIEHSIT